MKEDKEYKDLPQIIDVDVEPDMDFELREPEDEVETEDKSKYIEEYTKVQESLKEEIIEVEGVYEEGDFIPDEDNHIEEEPKREDSLKREEKKSVKEPYTFEKPHTTREKTETNKQNRDTSFTTFKANQQEGEKKWRKRIWDKFKKVLFILLMLFIGIPLLGTGGFFVVVSVGTGILLCGMIFGMGVLGLGVSAFMATAEIAGLGPMMFFMSLVGIGGGGLGLLLIWCVLLGLKYLVVKCYGYIRQKMTQEVA